MRGSMSWNDTAKAAALAALVRAHAADAPNRRRRTVALEPARRLGVARPPSRCEPRVPRRPTPAARSAITDRRIALVVPGRNEQRTSLRRVRPRTPTSPGLDQAHRLPPGPARPADEGALRRPAIGSPSEQLLHQARHVRHGSKRRTSARSDPFLFAALIPWHSPGFPSPA